MYSALELARAAGFLIRPVPTGGVTAIEDGPLRVMEVGPQADVRAIVAHARRFIVFPLRAQIATRPVKLLVG